MITGRSASRSSAAACSIARGSAPAPSHGSGSAAGGSGSPASMNTWSSGKSRNAGPECGVSAVAHRLVDEAGDLRGRVAASPRA